MSRKIREEIWNLLVSKGFEVDVSSHNSMILKKQKEVRSPNSKFKTVFQIVKYKFGKNNLQKFTNKFRNFSIPYEYLDIVDGKITRKKV